MDVSLDDSLKSDEEQLEEDDEKNLQHLAPIRAIMDDEGYMYYVTTHDG